MSNQVFPTLPGLSWSIVKSPIWKTVSQESVSGMEIRLGLTTFPRWRITLIFEILRSTNGFTELQQLIGFFNLMRGSCDTFLFQDQDDYNVNSQVFGTGDGSNHTFYISRQYGAFSEPIQDFITPPQIYVNGALKYLGSDYTIALGVVTFTAAPAVGALVAWTGQFYKRVRFVNDEAEFEQFMFGLWNAKKIELITVKQ